MAKARAYDAGELRAYVARHRRTRAAATLEQLLEQRDQAHQDRADAQVALSAARGTLAVLEAELAALRAELTCLRAVRRCPPPPAEAPGG